jgi:hypothetical protein
MATIFEEISAARARQIAKGYDAAHDDGHTGGEIAQGAAALALAACGGASVPTGDRRRRRVDPIRPQMGWEWIERRVAVSPSAIWPWPNGLSVTSPRDALINSAAMIVAELERLDRVSSRPTQSSRKAQKI